jgi:hypothetical protein
MRVAFYCSDKPREHLLADAVLMGARRHGHETHEVALGAEPAPGAFDVVCLVGVKSRERFREQHRAGAHVIYFDKGYSRHKSRGALAGWEYWRVAVDAHQPTERLAGLTMPPDRWEALGLPMRRWRRRRQEGPIVIAGSSMKYHEFYGLPHPTTYAKELVRQLRGITDRPLIYRPKPSWREATEIKKAAFSRLPETLDDLLRTAHVLVTHGSNACYEAVLAGVPSIVLGEGVAKPLSSTELRDVLHPRQANEADRLQWAANLAYHQWTLAEHASGEAWTFIGNQLHAV